MGTKLYKHYAASIIFVPYMMINVLPLFVADAWSLVEYMADVWELLMCSMMIHGHAFVDAAVLLVAGAADTGPDDGISAAVDTAAAGTAGVGTAAAGTAAAGIAAAVVAVVEQEHSSMADLLFLN